VLLTDGVVEFYSRSNFCPALLSVVERQVLASAATAEDLFIPHFSFVSFCFMHFRTQSFGAY
jgi:hypothetical protein